MELYTCFDTLICDAERCFKVIADPRTQAVLIVCADGLHMIHRECALRVSPETKYIGNIKVD